MANRGLVLGQLYSSAVGRRFLYCKKMPITTSRPSRGPRKPQFDTTRKTMMLYPAGHSTTTVWHITTLLAAIFQAVTSWLSGAQTAHESVIHPTLCHNGRPMREMDIWEIDQREFRRNGLQSSLPFNGTDAHETVSSLLHHHCPAAVSKCGTVQGPQRCRCAGCR